MFLFEIDTADYVYLLGLYLGDGCITNTGRTHQLRISLDATYPGLVLDCAEVLEGISPNRVSIAKQRNARCFIVGSSWKLWPVLLPQHGGGPKHTRPIILTPWQQDMVDRHPAHLLRGLIQSDGCRTVNRFKTKLPSGRIAEYEYVRYFFSNLSPDIRRLFCETCEALGIRWTQSNPRNISVSHRASVAILENIVGPKT